MGWWGFVLLAALQEVTDEVEAVAGHPAADALLVVFEELDGFLLRERDAVDATDADDVIGVEAAWGIGEARPVIDGRLGFGLLLLRGPEGPLESLVGFEVAGRWRAVGDGPVKFAAERVEAILADPAIELVRGEAIVLNRAQEDVAGVFGVGPVHFGDFLHAAPARVAEVEAPGFAVFGVVEGLAVEEREAAMARVALYFAGLATHGSSSTVWVRGFQDLRTGGQKASPPAWRRAAG